MLRQAVFILISLVPLFAFSQNGTISGKVTDSKTGEALPYVSVFLSNATKGTQTNAEGNFTLNGIKTGQYDLTVSLLGYLNYSQPISVNNNQQVINVKIEKRAHELAEVTIGPDPNRARYLEDFKREFIGNTENAPLTEITNPQILRLSYDKNKIELKASTDDFLIIENKGLGYRLKYLLNNFNKDYRTAILYHEGQVLFEEMEGSSAQIKRWKRNRLEAYLGSSMHFYRSLMQNKLSANGFEPHTLIRKSNPARPADSLITAKIQTFRRTGNSDSLNYWGNKSRIPKIIQILEKDTLRTADIIKRTNQQNLHALDFNDYLYVIYTKKRIPPPATGGNAFTAIQRPLVSDKGHPVTIITSIERPALFDLNGIVLSPRSVMYEGAWSASVAEMLPVDYDPDL